MTVLKKRHFTGGGGKTIEQREWGGGERAQWERGAGEMREKQVGSGNQPKQNMYVKIPCRFSVSRTHITPANHGFLGPVCIEGKMAT